MTIEITESIDESSIEIKFTPSERTVFTLVMACLTGSLFAHSPKNHLNNSRCYLLFLKVLEPSPREDRMEPRKMKLRKMLKSLLSIALFSFLGHDSLGRSSPWFPQHKLTDIFCDISWWNTHGRKGRLEACLFCRNSSGIILRFYDNNRNSIQYRNGIFRRGFRNLGLSNHIISDYTYANISKWQEKRVESSVVFVERYRELLSQYNEGVGGWRSLSHVRDSGSGVLITLSDSSNPLLIIGKIASSEIDCKIIFRFSKREPEFRDRVLGILEEKFVDNRVQKKAKSIHINPKQEIDRNSLITKFVMICPPLILLASIGFNEMTSNLPISTLLGFIVGGFLGGLIATNRTH